MSELINWLRDQPTELLVALGLVLIAPVMISWTLLGAKKYSRWWLLVAVLPLVGWGLVCVLLVLPGLQRSEEEEVSMKLAVSYAWRGLMIMFLSLAIIAFNAWSFRRPPPLPELNDASVRPTIYSSVQSIYQPFRMSHGALELGQVEELEYDAVAEQRTGRAIVKHKGGRDFIRVTLTRSDTDRRAIRVAIALDQAEGPATQSPPEVRGFNEGWVRLMILDRVQAVYGSRGRENLGRPEIVDVEELGYDEAAGQRIGRAIVQDKLGQEFFRVKLIRSEAVPSRIEVEIDWDNPALLSPKLSQVRQRLLEELAELPVVRELGLSTDQLTSLSFVESPSDPGSTERRGEVHLPAGAGKPAVVLKFLVHWCDLAQTCPGIQWFDGELPTLESAAFQHELKHAVEDWPQFRENSDTYGTPVCERVEPMIFDAEQQQRFYRVHVRHARGETQLSVVNRWKNREGGFWEVKVLEP